MDFKSYDNPVSIEKDSFNEKNWQNSIDFLWLEITNKCNLNCMHCYADSNPFNPLLSKMNYENWKSVLEESYTLGCKKMQFIGGEPTIHPDLGQMIGDARNIGYNFMEVYTNGLSIGDKLFETFKENDINLAFSLYGPNAEIHEKVTERPNSFE